MSIKIRIDVEYNGLLQRLARFQGAIQVELYPAWARIANRMHKEQLQLAPHDTGRLKRNIINRPHVMGVDGFSMAFDPRNGYNYAGIQHYGGYASGWYGPHFITGKFYMTIPLITSLFYVEDELDSEIAKIIARCGL